MGMGAPHGGETAATGQRERHKVAPQGPQARLRLPSMEEPGALADAIAPLLPIAIEQRQQLLETADVVARLQAILELMKSSRHAA